MPINAPASLDILTTDEVELARSMVNELADVEWAQKLIKQIKLGNHITASEKSRFFELRFAYRLHTSGIYPAYETKGEGESEIDFSFPSRNASWRVELMRLDETQSSKSATTRIGCRTSRFLMPPPLHDNEDETKQSIEFEMLKTVRRITAKCISKGKPNKFPTPSGNIHAILVDISNYFEGGANYDLIQIAYGPKYVPSAFRMHHKGSPVNGAFDTENPMAGSNNVRERVHFIIFEGPTIFNPFSPSCLYLFSNPHLFRSKKEAGEAFESFPLEPKKLFYLENFLY